MYFLSINFQQTESKNIKFLKFLVCETFRYFKTIGGGQSNFFLKYDLAYTCRKFSPLSHSFYRIKKFKVFYKLICTIFGQTFQPLEVGTNIFRQDYFKILKSKIFPTPPSSLKLSVFNFKTMFMNVLHRH